MKKGILILTGFILLLFLIDFEWIAHLRNEDMDYFTDGILEEAGYGLLWITIPLMVLQGSVTIFPVIVVILIHFISFGVVEGFIFSMIGTTIGALVCYWLAESFSGKWVDRFWEKREKALSKILRQINEYGVLMLVVLRSIPVMPSNLISIAAAFSPINFRSYLISTILGNISMIWPLSLLSAPLWISGPLFLPYLTAYIIFAAIVLGSYLYRFFTTEESTTRRRRFRRLSLGRK